MPPLDIPASTTKYDVIALAGGLDLLTPPLSLKPGRVREGLNWECSIAGGYSQSGGSEPHDGRPSAAARATQYTTLTSDRTTHPADFASALGNTITGSVSGASAHVFYLDYYDGADVLVVLDLAGVFEPGETLFVGSVAIGPMLALGGAGTEGRTQPDFAGHMRYLAYVHYAAAVTPVPGRGPVRGVAVLGQALFAWRDSADAAHLLVWRATPGGWQAVSLGALSLLPGGRVQTEVCNFDGTPKLYGCDGVNLAFEFDGASYVQIPTGNVPDRPAHLQMHKNHLFLAFGSNYQSSGIGDPFDWTAGGGSFSSRLDDIITGFIRLPGDQSSGALAITTQAATVMLYGNSSADFQQVVFEGSSGARAYSHQRIGGQALMFGDIGVQSIGATQSFGNFLPASLTMTIRPWTQARRTLCSASLENREKSQYRVFFSDGYALYVTMANGKLVGSMPQFFSAPVLCACLGPATDGQEPAYVGRADGYVCALSDRAPAEPGYLQFAFAHQGNSRIAKRYSGASFEVRGESWSTFSVTYQLGYSGPDRPQGDTPTKLASNLSTAQWDSGLPWWDDSASVWDGRVLAPSDMRLEGTGHNIALRVDTASQERIFDPMTINSIILHYRVRKAAKA